MKTLAFASIGRQTRCLIEWQLLTMTRPAEAAMTRWNEIHFEIKEWRIPAGRMKMKRMGFKDILVAHGMRSIAQTVLNEKGFQPDVIEAALAHIGTNEVRRAYNRSQYLEQRRDMMAWWGKHFEQSASGNYSFSSGLKNDREDHVYDVKV